MTDDAKSGFGSISEALAAAEDAMGLEGEELLDLSDGHPGKSSSSVGDDTQTSSLEDTEGDGEQTADAEDSEQEIVKLSDLLASDEEPDDSGSSEITDDTLVEFEGEMVTIRDLKDGNLRNKDYTQKTQEVANRSRELEKASEIWDLLNQDPVTTIAQLALEAQLIDTAQFEAVTKGREGSVQASGRLLESNTDSTTSQSDIDALVAAKVQEVLSTDPSIEQIRKEQSRNEILSSLKSLEDKYSLSLDDQDRVAVLQTAAKTRQPNLEVVLLQMLRQVEVSQEARERVKQASGGKLKSTKAPKEVKTRASSIREAWQMAEATQ